MRDREGNQCITDGITRITLRDFLYPYPKDDEERDLAALLYEIPIEFPLGRLLNYIDEMERLEEEGMEAEVMEADHADS